ncbi:hypothetical protein COY27_05830 [Candidatus Woesearchaeota archaeon CG_4_10_14_0_2_um_filter_33_13]|nr:MAG: hypothetical protein COY27_05830 [Candidatus Woesearchaeota archaeon CG_4_10_14_0_2_um_filter_33_13]
MSTKKLLGLENCPLTEAEIMQRIAEAKKNNIKVVEFIFDQHKVSVKVSQVHPEGLMRGWADYFKDNW